MNFRKFLPISLLVALILGVVVLAFPGGIAAAQAPTPPVKDPQAQIARINARLEKLFQGEQKMLDKQAQNLDKLDQLTTRVADLIAKAKANGKDTAALEAALTTFKGKQADARTQHSAAADLIKAHGGFDANGKVTDRAQAKDTVSSGHNLLQDARQTIVQAAKDFRDAVKSWRSANPPKVTK